MPKLAGNFEQRIIGGIYMKKTASFLVAASMLAATPAYSASSFTDMARYDDTTQQAVNDLVDRQIIKGTSSTTFSPAREITRGQVVKMLGRYLEAAGKAVPTNWETKARFTDVPLSINDRELLKYAALVYDEGVFVGSDGKLNAASMLTRENLVLVLTRLVKDVDLAKYANDKGLTGNVKDLAAVKEEAKEAVQLFNALGISNVDVFNPKDAVLRVHFASFLAKLLQTIENVEQEEATSDAPIVKPVAPEQESETDTDIVKPVAPEQETNTEQPTAPDETETKPEEPNVTAPNIDEEPLPPTAGENTTPPSTGGNSTIPNEQGPIVSDEEDEEPTYTFELEDVENVEIVSSTSSEVVIRYENDVVKLGVEEALAPIFNESAMLSGAIVSLSMEDDVVTAINALHVTASGSAASPITIDGALFEEPVPIVIEAQYANVKNFADYYDTIDIQAPANAVYTVGAGEFETITGKGSLMITFTEAIAYEVTIDAPAAQVIVAENASLETLTSTEALSITVQPGGHLQDVYLPAHVDTLTMHGDIVSVNVETTSSFTLKGFGNVYELFGEATAVYVEQNGIVVHELYVDPFVDEVTIK